MKCAKCGLDLLGFTTCQGCGHRNDDFSCKSQRSESAVINGKFTEFVDGLAETEVRGLCAVLLLRRSVDGMDGRLDHDFRYEDYEYSVRDYLESVGLEDTKEGE